MLYWRCFINQYPCRGVKVCDRVQKDCQGSRCMAPLTAVKITVKQVRFHGVDRDVYSTLVVVIVLLESCVNRARKQACLREWCLRHALVQSCVASKRGALWLVLTLRDRDTIGAIFADGTFKWFFLNENIWIWIEFSLRFVPNGPVNTIQALVQIMAWRRPGAKPWFEPMMVRLLTHIGVTRPQ